MSPDYDAADGEVAITEQFVFSNKGSTDSPVYKERQELILDPASLNRLFKSHTVMSDERFDSTSQDEKTIDPCQVFICSDTTIPTGTSFGKLLIDYEVEFFNPCAPTEQVNQGGLNLQGTQANNDLVSNSPTQPLSGGIRSFVKYKQDEVPFLQPEAIGDTLNTATLGKFVRDWEGVVQTYQTGTTFSGLPSIQLDSVNGAADTATAVLQPLVNSLHSLNGGATLGIDTFNVKAVAGQYLKLRSYANVALNQLDFIMGGATRATLL